MKIKVRSTEITKQLKAQFNYKFYVYIPKKRKSSILLNFLFLGATGSDTRLVFLSDHRIKGFKSVIDVTRG